MRRIQRGADDSALTIGTAKDLLEAAARHRVVELVGAYNEREGFPNTVFRACTAAGVAVPSSTMMHELDDNPFRALEQSLILVGLAINRLRNAEGIGHGRPQRTKASYRQGVVAAQAAASVCFLLLPELTDGTT